MSRILIYNNSKCEISLIWKCSIMKLEMGRELGNLRSMDGVGVRGIIEVGFALGKTSDAEFGSVIEMNEKKYREKR